MTLLFVIIATFLVFNIKYRKYVNPYKLYMIFGKKGSGKTTYLCKIALKYKKKGYIVYTNVQDMCIEGVRVIDPETLGEFIPEPQSCVLLDEVGMLYDNRNFKNFRPEVRDFFKLQRHYKIVVYLASQSFDIDKKLRDLTDRMYLVSAITPWLSLVRPISKKIGLVEASAQGESRIVENLKFMLFTKWRFTFIPKYVKYFDSFVVPHRAYLQYEEKRTDRSEKVSKSKTFPFKTKEIR